MALLISLGNHDNVLGLIGVCTSQFFPQDEEWSPLLVTEYMPYGDLLHFLWESREVNFWAAAFRFHPDFSADDYNIQLIGFMYSVLCGKAVVKSWVWEKELRIFILQCITHRNDMSMR